MVVEFRTSSTSVNEEIEVLKLRPKENTRDRKFPALSRRNGWISVNENVSNVRESRISMKTQPIMPTTMKVVNDTKDDENNKGSSSKVFIRDNQGKFFMLTFRATNCNITPLYSIQRELVCYIKDKKVQPRSKTYYYEEYQPFLQHINLRSKRFRLTKDSDIVKSVMSFKAKVGQQMKTEPKKAKKIDRISATRSNIKRSVVYITTMNINFKLYPKMMTLDFSKPFDIVNLSNDLYRDLGLETNEQKKNKGCLIAKYKEDILKFTFNIEEIIYQPIPEMITRSCQVKDNAIYIRFFSEISNKVVNAGLPRNTYKYKDPMVEVRRKNRLMKIHHIEPRWMVETRQERLMNYKKCHQENKGQKAYEATSGSSIVYEAPGTLNKARGGLIFCEISQHERDNYEAWIIDSQNENLNMSELEKLNSSSDCAVPSWNMVLNSA